MTIPKPTLGNITAITITTPDLETSLAFYLKLGFKELFRADMPFPWIQITDGALLIMLRKDSQPYIALTYYVTDVDKTVAELTKAGISFVTKPNPNDMIKRCLMRSPDGMNVSLVTLVEGFFQPSGTTLLTMPPADFSNPEKYPNAVCGIFGEFACPVTDIDASMVFWTKLGFVLLSRRTAPYPWAIISDGLSIIGLHQTGSFTNPTITFFAKDMKDKIENLKNNGITHFTEKGGANIVLTSPEKQNINLFQLGM
jgi:predicted lactoylglutathione lyase